MASEINLKVSLSELRHIHDAIGIYLATISQYPEYEQIKQLSKIIETAVRENEKPIIKAEE